MFGNAIGNSVVAEMQESARWNSIKQAEEIARQADNPTGQFDNISSGSTAFSEDVARRTAELNANRPAWLRSWDPSAPLVELGSAPDLNPAQTQQPRTYVVQRGDTLSGIAKDSYGDPLLYAAIMARNGIEPGQERNLQTGRELIIPTREEINELIARRVSGLLYQRDDALQQLSRVPPSNIEQPLAQTTPPAPVNSPAETILACGRPAPTPQEQWQQQIDAAKITRGRFMSAAPNNIGPSFQQRLEMAIVLPPTIAMASVATTGLLGSLGSRFLASQLALQPVPLAQLGTTELVKGMASGGAASTFLYAVTHGADSTPAGAATAFAAGAVGAGLVKQSLNAAALLPNTAIPFTYSNAVTQATGAAFGFGTFGWLNLGGVTASGNSWWTTPILAPRPPEPPKPKP